MTVSQDYKNTDSAAMPHTRAVTCKLPLLDGGRNSTARTIDAEVELQHAVALQELARDEDPTPFHDILCTAWGLLLRCYTGQDDVFFQFRQTSRFSETVSGGPATPRSERLSGFQMAFNEHEKLSKYTERAREGRIAPFEERRLRSTATGSNAHDTSGTSDSNTVIWVQQSRSADTRIVNTADIEVCGRLSI